MTDLQRLLAALIPVAGLVGCVSMLPQHTPSPDPPGEYAALTTPIIALGDTQEHEATGFPLHDNEGAVDSYIEVAQRPPAQPLYGRRILEWVIQSHPDAPVIHLGDVLDMSCESEIGRIGKIFAAATQPTVILPGNHDGLLFGIYNHNLHDIVLDPGAAKWDRGCRRGANPDAQAGHDDALTKPEFIETYLVGLASDPHQPQHGLVAPSHHGNTKTSWRNPNPNAFIEAIEVSIVDGWRYARSFIAQKLRLPPASGAARPVMIIALDTNQVGPVVSTLDTLRGLSPGSSGQVRADQIEAISTWVGEARRAGQIVVFAGHHNWAALSLGSRHRLAALMQQLDHPLVYVSAHTHRGFWAMHEVEGRKLLELNVSSLSDWPIAYRRVTFHYDARANRIKVVGELMPNLGAPPRDDAELLRAWDTMTCAQSGVAAERVRAEVLALVKEQKASRGTLVEWIYEGLGEDCESCLKMMYDHAHRYQDEMLESIRETHSDLGDEAPEIRTFKVPAFCGALELPACIDALRRETPGDLESDVALFRKKTQLVDQVNARLDEVRSPHAKAYMTCRAVLAANDDFELTPDDRNDNRGEAFRRSQDFFRTEATVGMH